jgi:hypothetical protein
MSPLKLQRKYGSGPSSATLWQTRADGFPRCFISVTPAMLEEASNKTSDTASDTASDKVSDKDGEREWQFLDARLHSSRSNYSC